MESKFNASVTITNMRDEMFNDALFYKEMAENTSNIFIKRRYSRAAMVFFCAAAESWMNSIICENLREKSKTESNEQGLLNFLENPNGKMPYRFNSIKNRLYNIIPKVIIGECINWEKDEQKPFEDYILLSRMRNNIVHYSTKNENEIYSTKFFDLLQKAPDIIEELFKKYDAMGCKLGIAPWFKEKQSRLIE